MPTDLQLSPTAHVVLGLVSLRPRAGHELAEFAERSIGMFFPLTRSHIYSELDRLHRAGMLDATDVQQARSPTKRVYAITADGTAELQRWLDESELSAERYRIPFLVRVFFGDRMSPGRVEALLDEFAAGACARRDALATIVEMLADRPDAAFRRATAMFGVRREQAHLDWVADMRPILRSAAAASGNLNSRSEQTTC